ncbi:MAG: hypothetical protein KJ064_21000 [Anaerolineae bacterium]|nr:hypothetical protein [Anaerolineae bacterium]
MEGGSSFGDFISQIQGLIFITVGAGVLWLFLTYLIFQRAAERRRRQREGLDPLPSFFTQAYHYLTKSTEAGGQSVPARPTSAAMMPDLDALTADLPSPNLASLTEDFEAPPVIEGEFVEESAPAVRVVEAAISDEFVIPVSEPAVSDSLTYVPGSNELPGDAVEMMRVWRDVSDGRLIIGMKDQLFGSLNEVQDAALRSRFKKLIQDLNQIASIQSVSPPAPTPRPPASEPATPEMGFADQIETYLQAKLLRNPSLFGRSIHVHAAAGGGVSIEVDGQRYEAVSDVDDLDVRRFLQETIQEWESKH